MTRIRPIRITQTLTKVVLLTTICLISSISLSQEDPPTSLKKQKKLIAKKEKVKKKAKKNAYKNAKKHHKRIQTKETRKRMRKNERNMRRRRKGQKVKVDY